MKRVLPKSHPAIFLKIFIKCFLFPLVVVIKAHPFFVAIYPDARATGVNAIAIQISIGTTQWCFNYIHYPTWGQALSQKL